MPLITWEKYADLIEGICHGSIKVIGWGAGLGFIRYHQRTMIKHAYLIDKDQDKWGLKICGFEVKPPQTLASEDPETIIIIIYNFFDHGKSVLSDIEKIGSYNSIMNFNPFELIKFSHRLSEVPLNLKKKVRAKSKLGIIVQGPIYEKNTVSILKYYANKYPEDWLILSTWYDADARDLSEAERYCDEIVINQHVKPGFWNRNRLIVSTQSGLMKAKEVGIEFVLKTRSDTLATAPGILNRSVSLLRKMNKQKCENFGLNHRIITSERYTQLYVPYHVSDMILFGDVDDLMKYFHAPIDERDLNIQDIRLASLKSLWAHGYLNEIYLYNNFLAKIGWQTAGSLIDYWTTIGNFLIVVDERWFGHFFPKYDLNHLDELKSEQDLNCYIGFNQWSALYNGGPELYNSDLDIDSLTYDDLIKNKRVC